MKKKSAISILVQKNYHLIRKRITDRERKIYKFVGKNDTHLITINVQIAHDKWETLPKSIQPSHLRRTIKLMIREIINEANDYYKEIPFITK